MIWVYGIGYVAASVMGAINIHKLYKLFTNQLSEDELVQVMESEDQAPEPVPEPAPHSRPGAAA